METFTDVTDLLTAFALDHDLVARAERGCATFLHNEAEGSGLPRGWSPRDIRVQFRSHSLTFRSSLLPYPYVATLLDLHVGDEHVGWYKLVVRTDGEEDDDYLVFYPERMEERDSTD